MENRQELGRQAWQEALASQAVEKAGADQFLQMMGRWQNGPIRVLSENMKKHEERCNRYVSNKIVLFARTAILSPDLRI